MASLGNHPWVEEEQKPLLAPDGEDKDKDKEGADDDAEDDDDLDDRGR